MSFHNVLPKLLNQLVNASGWTLTVMHIELLVLQVPYFGPKSFCPPFCQTVDLT